MTTPHDPSLSPRHSSASDVKFDGSPASTVTNGAKAQAEVSAWAAGLRHRPPRTEHAPHSAVGSFALTSKHFDAINAATSVIALIWRIGRHVGPNATGRT